MRKQLFSAIAQRLETHATGVAYIDLWNTHLDEMEGGAVWPTPAVFIEFETIEWEQLGLSLRQGDVAVRLHIVTQAVDHNGNDERIEEALKRFDLIEQIQQAICGLAGEGFAPLQLTTSATNHQHDELIEDIERYVTRAQEADRFIRRNEVNITPNISR